MNFTPNTLMALAFQDKILANILEGEAEKTSVGAVKFRIQEVGGTLDTVLWIHPGDSPNYTLSQVRYTFLGVLLRADLCRALARELFNLAREHSDAVL